MNRLWLKVLCVICVLLLQSTAGARGLSMAAGDLNNDSSNSHSSCHSNPAPDVFELIPLDSDDCCQTEAQCQEVCAAMVAVTCADLTARCVVSLSTHFVFSPATLNGPYLPDILKPPIQI